MKKTLELINTIRGKGKDRLNHNLLLIMKKLPIKE